MTSANCDTPDPEYALQRCISPRQSFHANQPLLGVTAFLEVRRLVKTENWKALKILNVKTEEFKIA